MTATTRRSAALAAALGLGLAAGGPAAQTAGGAAPLTPAFDANAVLTCRAYAIVQQNRREDGARLGAAETQALLEQANLALILGVLRRPVKSMRWLQTSAIFTLFCERRCELTTC